MSSAESKQPTDLLRSLLRRLVLLIVVMSAGFLGIILWGAYSAVGSLSDTAIRRASSQTHVELERFFGPVTANLQMATQWAAAGELDPTDIEGMNRRFIPLLQNYEQISSMLVATPEGVEYMLLRRDDGWVNRSTDVANRPGTTQWTRWESLTTKAETWEKKVDYDPRKRPWFQVAQKSKTGTVSWTEPYVFFTTKDPGITAASRVDTPSGQITVAFDVLLLDVSRFTTNLEVSERGKVSVLTQQGAVLGLPAAAHLTDTPSLKKFVLKKPNEIEVGPLAAATDAWAQRGGEQGALRFHEGGEQWQGQFEPFPLGAEKLWIAVAVPEEDFRGSVTGQRVAILVLALLGVILAFALALSMTRQYKRSLSAAVSQAQRQLGQYRLEKKIGEGGMGAVYRASHVMMRRPTAVKLLQQEKASPEFVQRFEREVQMTCRLTHPNTIAIYDYGRTPDGTFYYAMELLNGVSLAAFLPVARRLNEGRTIHLLRQIGESLREAHSIGLIHRDIKPGNIQICERGGQYDVIKVLDFGLVKDVKASQDENLTGETSWGTPGFVAPETVRDASASSALSDIYAFGTVAYAMLTGTTIFPERNKVRMLLRQMKEDPEPPSVRINRHVDPDLEALVMRCIAREPRLRPQSMDEVLDVLARCGASSSWTQADARSWWRDHLDLLQPEGATIDDHSPTMSVDVSDRR